MSSDKIFARKLLKWESRCNEPMQQLKLDEH